MNKHAFVKRIIVAGGFLILCAAPGPGFGQSSPAGAVQSRRMKPPAPQPRKSGALPPDLLAGLTLTDEQKTKIAEIKQNTKSRLEAVAKDEKLGPEVKDAMAGGFQRLENGRIFDVLSPEQQRDVRKRMSAWKDAQKQNQPNQLKLTTQAPAVSAQPK